MNDDNINNDNVNDEHQENEETPEEILEGDTSELTDEEREIAALNSLMGDDAPKAPPAPTILDPHDLYGATYDDDEKVKREFDLKTATFAAVGATPLKTATASTVSKMLGLEHGEAKAALDEEVIDGRLTMIMSGVYSVSPHFQGAHNGYYAGLLHDVVASYARFADGAWNMTDVYCLGIGSEPGDVKKEMIDEVKDRVKRYADKGFVNIHHETEENIAISLDPQKIPSFYEYVMAEAKEMPQRIKAGRQVALELTNMGGSIEGGDAQVNLEKELEDMKRAKLLEGENKTRKHLDKQREEDGKEIDPNDSLWDFDENGPFGSFGDDEDDEGGDE